MSLPDIFLDKITEEDLNALKSTGVPESQTIDYKRDTYGNSDSDKREFLADITSFANALGGDIVIGIDEANGLPTAIVPITGDIDAEVRRLESIALTGIEPRLTNLRIRPVPVTGGHVIIVRVPRSYIPPHRVIAQSSNRFYARAGTKKYEPNVEQLRHLFTDAPRMVERIRSFQTDRLVKIAGGDTPIPMSQIGKVVVHVIPLPSFIDGRMADIVSEVEVVRQRLLDSEPQLSKGHHLPVPLDLFGFANAAAVNLDGYLNYAQVPEAKSKSYAQFFRNGAIEGVGELQTDDGVTSRFLTTYLTNVVLSRVYQYLQVLKSYDMGLPIYVYLSICNATRTVHRYQPPYGNFAETSPLTREIVACPEIYIDSFEIDLIDAMRPAFNTLWNAVGHLRCERYDDLTKWKASNPYALKWS
jgi:Putative DNA-binding domain